MARANPKWQQADECTVCGQGGFGLMNKKSHCRSCGWVLCGDCVSDKTFILDRWVDSSALHNVRSKEALKVCTFCEEDLTTARENRAAEARASPRWAQSKVCMVCDQSFTFTNKKHHCRSCGWVACGDCSLESFFLDRWLDDSNDHEIVTERSSEPLRVCGHCKGAIIAEKERKLAAARESPQWIQAEECMLCDKSFSVMSKKHHCRSCGWAACGDCASGKLVLDRWLDSRTGQVQTTRSTKKLRVCHSCDTALTGPGQPPAAAVVEEEDETSDDEVLFETVPSPRPAAAAPAPGPAPIAEADAGEERKRRLKASFGALGQRESFALQPAAEPEAAPDESDDFDGAAPAEPLLLGKNKEWSAMTEREREAVECLGWTEHSWTDPEMLDEADDPFERAYGDLNRDEQAAADMLGMEPSEFQGEAI